MFKPITYRQHAETFTVRETPYPRHLGFRVDPQEVWERRLPESTERAASALPLAHSYRGFGVAELMLGISPRRKILEVITTNWKPGPGSEKVCGAVSAARIHRERRSRIFGALVSSTESWTDGVSGVEADTVHPCAEVCLPRVFAASPCIEDDIPVVTNNPKTGATEHFTRDELLELHGFQWRPNLNTHYGQTAPNPLPAYGPPLPGPTSVLVRSRLSL